MKKTALTSALILCCSLTSPAALADPVNLDTDVEVSSESSVRHLLKLDVGALSATGLGGIGYILEPVSWFQLEAAVGYGFSGFQFSLMPKINVGNAHHRFVAGAGVSVAVLPWDADPKADEVMVYLNVDLLGYEYRFADRGWFLSAAAGGTMVLRSPYGDDHQFIQEFIPAPQGRLSVGYRF